ncbi:MAG: ERF family protein [Pyrinomonadaceae bacterium]
MSEKTSPSLYERINRVKAEIKRVPKSGKNTHFKFDYATESDISDLIRPLMAKHGVCLLYHGPDRDRIQIEEGKTAAGGSNFFYQIWVHYELVNVDNPQERETVWAPGEALDTQDKGMNKALTAAAKYAWLKIFDISTGDPTEDTGPVDEPDKCGSDDPRPSQKPAPKPKTQKVIGATGLKRIQEKAEALDLSREDIVNALLNLGHGDEIRGAWEYPEKWPASLLPVIGEIFNSHSETNKAKDKVDEEDEFSILVKEIDSKWKSMMGTKKPFAGEPKNPEEMANAAIQENPNLSLAQLAYMVREGKMLYPGGQLIPF